MTDFTQEHAAAHTSTHHRAPQVVLTTWKGEQEFETGKPGTPPLLIDSHGKKSSGPVEALLGALAACAATDVVEILAKRRTPVESLVIESFGTRVDGTPRKLEHVLMRFKIAGKGIERVHAERAIDLAVNKYCSVGASLDPAIKVEWALELTAE